MTSLADAVCCASDLDLVVETSSDDAFVLGLIMMLLDLFTPDPVAAVIIDGETVCVLAVMALLDEFVPSVNTVLFA